MKIKKEECTVKKTVDTIENADICVSPTYKILLGDKVPDFTCPTKCSPDTILNEKSKNNFSVSNSSHVEGNSVMWPPPSGILRQALLSFSVPTEKPDLNDPPSGILRQALMSFNPPGEKIIEDEQESSENKKLSAVLNTKMELKRDVTASPLLSSLINDNTKNINFYSNNSQLNNNITMTTTPSDNLSILSLPMVSFPNTSVISNSAVIAVSSSNTSLACESNHINKVMIPQLSSQIVSCCSNVPTQSSPVYTHSRRNEINTNGIYATKSSRNIPELKLSKSSSAFVSSPPREANVTVVFSTVDRRKLVDNFTNGSTLHPIPKSKSSHLDTETELNVSKLEDMSDNNVLSNITPILATQSSLNLSEKLNDLNASAISCDINSIKLDDHQDEAIDFSSNALISLPESSMRFHNENSCSNLGSGILIPVSSSIILNKVDFSSHSSDDIEHIIIPNSLYGNHINTAATSQLSVTSKGSLQDSTLMGNGSSMSSIVSSESNLSLATWHNHTIPISKVSTVDTIVTPQSTETSYGNAPSSAINIVETSSLITSTTNSALQITGIGSTATCCSLSPKTTSPVFTISSSGSSSMDGNPYSLQSPAEILSQLSKAGVLPTMSSSQVSSVLSALGADTHLDIDTDNGHPSDNISNQILPLPHTGEKVSTPTQTDCVDLSHSVEVECIDTDEKSVGQHQTSNDDSIIVQQVMNMFNHHSDNSSATVVSKSPTLTSFVDSASSNHTAITTNTGSTNSVKGAPYPKIVAMVLNTSSTSVNKSSLSSPESLNIGSTIEGVILHSSNDVKVDQRTAVLPISSVFIKQEEYEGLSKSRAVNSETLNEPAPHCMNEKQKRSTGLRKNSPSLTAKSKSNKATKNAHKEINYSEESIKFVEQVSCYKCKFCSFINLQKSLVSSHIEHEHKLEIVSASDSCRLKCVGCSRLFCGTTALSKHLVNEHNISEDEVKNIVTMAIKSLVDEDLSKSKNRNKKKKVKSVQKDSVVLITESKDTNSQNNDQESVPSVATVETSKIRVKNLESQITVVTNILSPKESESKVTESSVSVEEEEVVNSGNVNVREDSLVIDFDPLVSQKQVNKTDLGQYRVVKSDNSDIIMIYEDNTVFAEENKKEVPAQIVKKRGRPKGSRNEPPVKSNINAEREQGYKCNIDNCAVRLRSHDNIEYHRRCHSHSGAQYVCPECSLIHCHWNGMSTHLWRVHLINMELFSCDQCSYKTTSYSKLVNLHKRIHGTERPFLCDTCGKGFKNQKQLRNHKVIHDTNTKSKPTMPGECELCGRTFSNMRKLRLHTDNVHRKIRPHLCSYCGYSASSISTLKMHMRQHTGEKPFNCSECEYRTSDHNSLRRHKMRHTGAKPYKCPHCDYACIQSSTYKAHLKTKHPGLDNGLMFSCNECSFRSVKEENYLAHLGQHKIGGIPQAKKRKKISDQNEETEETTFDVEFGSESVAHLVEPLLIEDPEDPGNELTSFSVSNMESVTEIQLSSEFEAEEITGDIHEPEELKFKIREDIKP